VLIDRHPYLVCQYAIDELTISGFFGDILNLLVQKMNMSYTGILSSDGLFGTLEPDGVSFNGLVGMVQERKAFYKCSYQ
jgi:hypothetical protein